jgi:hypothetical protein
MVAMQAQTWHQASQQALMNAIAQIRSVLEHYGRSQEDAAAQDKLPPPPVTLPPASEPGTASSALQMLAQVFGLSPFECNILLLCAGMEVSSQWGTLCGAAQGNVHWPFPTFGLAHLLFDPADWYATTPTAPLRRYRLLEINGGAALMTSQLRIDERIFHYLLGLNQADARLHNLVECLPAGSLANLVPSHRNAALQIIQTWSQTARNSPSLRHLPIAQLGGRDRHSHRQIAAAVCQHFNLQLHTLAAQCLPTDLQDVAFLRTLCEREYLLERSVYLVDLPDYDGLSGLPKGAIAQFVETIEAPVLLSSRTRYPLQQRPQIYLDIAPPTKPEQVDLWQRALAPLEVDLNGHVAALTSHFDLNVATIADACVHLQVQRELRRAEEGSGVADPGHGIEDFEFSYTSALWNYCRSQARPRLDELAQRIETRSSWEQLVLPDKERLILSEIAAHVRQRSRVYDLWGFGQQGTRGLGISALFAGASGTGKTLAAEVLANDLHLDLYRIDLSSIVSKYIGETEKNLRKVFDAAEGGGVILLFDEADALFGKRSEVKDSHDRYANMEVSYLLQCMEAYQGLAILTTNLKGSIDQAFLRRIRFVVQFPFPDASQRAEIWRRIFPAQMPRGELKYDKLAKLSVAGGNIRNIAVNAAFLAADAGDAVGMKHLLQAAQAEYLKLERPLTDPEIRGWL